MHTIGDYIGTLGTIKDRNPHFTGWNDRMDHIVKCPECGNGMAFTDILVIKDNSHPGYHRGTWACPHCSKFIDHVSCIIHRDGYIPEDVDKSVPKWVRMELKGGKRYYG